MSKYATAVERITYSSMAISLAAEVEKVTLHGALREQLAEPATWPLVYTSNILPAAIIGIAAGVAGTKMVQAGDRWVSEQDAKTSLPNKKLLAAAAGAMIALAPVKIGYTIEITDKCDIMSSEQRSILECEPDPIDAGSIFLGAAIGLAYATRRVETAQPTASV